MTGVAWLHWILCTGLTVFGILTEQGTSYWAPFGAAAMVISALGRKPV